MLLKIKKIVWKLFILLKIDSIYLLFRKGYLKESGWLKSYNKKISIDKDGNPIPWFTYAAISFLDERVNKDMSIFEYSCGNSTLWFAKKGKKVVSVEHDKSWYKKINKIIPFNATIFLKQENIKDYVESIGLKKEKYNIISIDGISRGKCIRQAVQYLTEDGMIILDNSEREKYVNGIQFLKKVGFKEIQFSGLGPINTYGWSTSIFYKSI